MGEEGKKRVFEGQCKQCRSCTAVYSVGAYNWANCFGEAYEWRAALLAAAGSRRCHLLDELQLPAPRWFSDTQACHLIINFDTALHLPFHSIYLRHMSYIDNGPILSHGQMKQSGYRYVTALVEPHSILPNTYTLQLWCHCPVRTLLNIYCVTAST